jgi:hypothetical protein
MGNCSPNTGRKLNVLVCAEDSTRGRVELRPGRARSPSVADNRSTSKIRVSSVFHPWLQNNLKGPHRYVVTF